MSKPLTLLMAQINPTVGDIDINTNKIIRIIEQHQQTHDIIVFPELALTGYPPEDLLLHASFFSRIQSALERIRLHVGACHVLIGHPEHDGNVCYNTASLFHQKQRIAYYHKQALPNYGVFDEQRYFKSGTSSPCIVDIKNHRVGICICEDVWHSAPVEQIIQAQATIMLCLNASPFDEQKQTQREQLLQEHAKRGITIVYVNLVGGQDELVFDGQSLAYNAKGILFVRAPAFREHLETITCPSDITSSQQITPSLEREALLYQALCCGLYDYVHKNNFPGVLLGLSGGIDSALTLAIAVDALGADKVHAVMMPSRYTADMSQEDALAQLHAMNVTQHTTLAIEPAFETLLHTLTPAFEQKPADVTEENLQARIRGLLLMALSNKHGKLVLTTSNKSETAVGYATLYGDMCGGFSVLKDVLKTSVYALARYRNAYHPVIPERVLTRAPSAELAPGQTDQDTLPNYEILDAIITHYMEEKLTIESIVALGYEHTIVEHVIRLIKRNEYKRRQSAPGVKISTCAFGRDWRYPITSKFNQ